jgi:integrase
VVFRRKGTRRFSFQARTETGFRQVPTGTTSKVQAQKMAGMWERLAMEARAWDLLNRVLAGSLTLGRLWDLWAAHDGNVAAIRRELDDVDLEPLVANFVTVYRQKHPKNLTLTLDRLRYLIPEGQRTPRSLVTPRWLTERLYDYAGAASTKRGVASAWSQFFDYCTRVHEHFEFNPMDRVDRPPPASPVVRYYEMDTVERIVGAQPDARLRAFFAIAYGTGIESGTTLRLTRADLHPSEREIYAPGTKTHTRQRMARVSAWAWPIIWDYAKTLLPTARLFPAEWGSERMSEIHEQTVKRDLQLGEYIKLHGARHHWAVLHLRAGVPVAVVQAQLGHSTPILTLKTYGAFIPTGDDRARWEAAMESDVARRREVK